MSFIRGKFLRRFIICSAIFSLVGAGVLLALHPFYWGGLLHLIGDRSGVSFSHYERLGNGRFILSELEVDLGRAEEGTTVLRIDRLEAPMPLAYVFSHDRDLQIEGWALDLVARAEKESEQASTPLTPSLLVATIVEPYGEYRHYVGEVEVVNGVLRADGATLEVSEIRLHADLLTADLIWLEQAERFELEMDLEDPDLLPIEIVVPKREVDLSLEIKRDGEYVGLEGALNYKRQSIPLVAEWGGSSWFPLKASFKVDGLIVDESWLQDYQLEPPLIATIDFSSVEAEWNGTLALEASSMQGGKAVGLDIALLLSGDTRFLKISELTILSSGITADLSAPLIVDRENLTTPDEAIFRFMADLGQLPYLELEGNAEGEARFLKSDGGAYPAIQFTLEGRDLVYDVYAFEAIDLTGKLSWPLLEIEKGDVKLDGSSRVSVAGSVDFEAELYHAISLKGKMGAEWFRRLEMEFLSFDEIVADIQLYGPWGVPTHSGGIGIRALEVYSEHAVDVRLDWKGAATTVDEFDLRGQDEGLATALQARGSLSYDRAGDVFSYDVEMEAVREILEEEPIAFHLASSAGAEGIKLNYLSLKQGTDEILRGEGRFPVRLQPMGEEKVELIATDAPFIFDVQTLRSGRALEELLADWGWEADQPEVNIHLEGPIEGLVGTVDLAAIRIQPPEDVFRQPVGTRPIVFEDLDAHLRFTEAGLELDRFSLFVFGEQIQATAALPLGDEGWRKILLERELPDVSLATADVICEAIPLTTLGPLLPDLFRPEGMVNGSLRLDPYKHLSAKLQLSGAATRPLAPFGTLRAIEANLEIEDRVVKVLNLSARLSDKPVTIDGTIGIKDPADPRFDLHLRGESLPLVRTSGIVLRGSPDLHILTKGSGETTIAGTVVLKDSIVTVDLADLSFDLSGGSVTTSGAPKRFPYFSVTQTPVDAWNLDVNIVGESFLDIRTPGFVGRVSADFDLGGTLAEPVAVGSMTVPQGSIRFPFANLLVTSAQVGTTVQDPFQPRIDVTAKGKSYGYDLTMEVSGYVDDPTVTFSSNPSLDSQSIVLLVTSGQIPSSDFAKSRNERLSGIGLYLSKSLLADFGWIDSSEDRLSIRVAEEVSRTGRDTVEIEYELDKKWSLQGNYDEFDTYNLDLRWKLFEK